MREPARLTVCFDDGVRVAARGGGVGGVRERAEPARRKGTGEEMSFFITPRQVSPIPFSIPLLLVFGERRGHVRAHNNTHTYAVQMVIYEVHGGRETGGARGGRDDGKGEEEEVLEKRRKQSPLVHIGLLTRALTGASLFPLLPCKLASLTRSTTSVWHA